MYFCFRFPAFCAISNLTGETQRLGRPIPRAKDALGWCGAPASTWSLCDLDLKGFPEQPRLIGTGQFRTVAEAFQRNSTQLEQHLTGFE